MSPAAPQDDHRPSPNGVVAQMEQEKEKEAQEERNNGQRTDRIVNGDMGQSNDHSPPQINRTGAESPTVNKDRGTGTESEQGNGEGGSDHKVRKCLLVAF